MVSTESISVRGLSLSPLEEQQVFLTVEPSLQPHRKGVKIIGLNFPKSKEAEPSGIQKVAASGP